MNYPPPYLTLDKLAEHLSVSTHTVERWVERGILPTPKKPDNGIRLWKWREVEKAMDRLAQRENDPRTLPVPMDNFNLGIHE